MQQFDNSSNTTIRHMPNFITFLLLFLAFHPLSAQGLLQGLVTDIEGTPLPFVNILINDSRTRGVNTDIDGKYAIEAVDSIFALTFSYLGYETRRVLLEQGQTKLDVVMQARAFGMQEIVVVAGENPADIIIRKATANRLLNHPDRLEAYQCRTYNKMVFTLTPREMEFDSFITQKDTSRRFFRRYHDNMRKLINKSKEHHLFIMESLTRRHYRSPEQVREIVLKNQVAGFQKAEFVALANSMQPFSFYDEELEVLDKRFLNPISRGSTDKYFFQLQDSLFQGVDTVFIIQYQPKKGKNFEGLSGVVYINSRGYAIQNIIAEPADSGFIQLRMEQQYTLVDDQHWFPEQLNFVLHAQKYPSPFVGLMVYGKSYIDSVLVNPIPDPDVFRTEEQITFSPNYEISSDSLWRLYRKEPLDELEERTYEIVDSTGMRLKFDKRLDQLEALASGRWPLLKFLDLSLTDVIAFNEFESIRLGLGLFTSDSFSEVVELGAYAGYGFNDQTWKYGGSLKLQLHERSTTELTFAWREDIREPAILETPLGNNLISRRFFARRMDQISEQEIRLESNSAKYLRLLAIIRRQKFHAAEDYRFLGLADNEENVYHFSETTFGFRYAFREQYVRFLGTRLPEATPFPILETYFSRGWKGLSQSDIDYHRISFILDHRFTFRNFGETHYRLEAGWTDRALPLAKLFNSSGFGRDFQFLTISNAFQTMDRYEFISDRFVHFFFKHNFGTLLGKTKKFKPEISLEHNMAVGSLRNPELHEGLLFQTLEKGYFESGLVLENLVRLNYFNFMYLGFGVGGYFRYGAYALPKMEENWAFRLAVSFSY